MKTSTIEVGELAMSGSSAVVAINALMLKRSRLDGIKKTKSPGARPVAAKLPIGAAA